jgi:hypothetical protein
MSASQRIGANYTPWWGGDERVDEHGNDESPTGAITSDEQGGEPAATSSFGTVPGGETNGARTSAWVAGPHAGVGITPSGDSVYVGAAAIKGRDARSGIELEVFTGSAQIGGQWEVQAGAARVGVSTDDAADSAGVEVFTARAAMGVHNVDGSFGWNAGALGTVVGAEGTLRLGTASSITAGAAIGWGLEGSLGLRDVDEDNEPEVCGRVVIGPVTAGLCVEMPFTAPSLVATPRTGNLR